MIISYCSVKVLPFPFNYLRKVNTVITYILFMLNQLIAHLLIEVGTSVAKLRKELKSILYKVETVYIVLHTYIEGSSDSAFLLITAYMHETIIMTTVCKFMNKCCITVEVEDNRLVCCKEHVILGI